MKLATFPDSPRPNWPRPVVALGNFDGLHRGHMRLVDEVRRQAGERGGTPIAMIFDPHPPRVLRPDKAPPLLMTLDQKLEAFGKAGLDAVAVVRFTKELSRWEPELFVETVLVDWLRVAEVWVGGNFLFGRDRSGTFSLLRSMGERLNFKAEKIDPIRYKDFVVSSTRIRHLVAEGRVDEAGALLGHHYFVDGTVVHGDGVGRELGFPTANLDVLNELLPAHGIYATLLRVDGTWRPSVSSIGVRPTLGEGGAVTVEAHLLDAEPGLDLYGMTVRLAFVSWLREERRYEGLDPLKAQIAADCVQARALFDAIEL